jgi:NADPH:quinone reductase
MKALLLNTDGSLRVENTHSPKLFPKGVRVAVRAVGVNRADILQARGLYPSPPGVRSDILGLEYAGEVIEAGKDVDPSLIGRRVMGIVPGASYAEEVVVHEQEILNIPKGLDWHSAAAIPEAFLTAYDALLQLNVNKGQTLLVHAIGSGVGNAAAQIIHAFGGICIGTSRTKEKLEQSKNFGMEYGIWVRDGAFLTELRSMAPGVDGVIDFIGSPYLQQNMSALKTKGTLVAVGLLGGRRADLDMGQLLRKRLTLKGTVLRSRGLEEKIALAQQFSEVVLPLFSTDKGLRPLVDTIFDIKNAEKAHALMLENQTFGKIVLKASSEGSWV